ncbi:MAG: signal peptide peptidase SppA [Deltaproteobacteria bacterium]|nr:signal peptide peptidase SppA [Deltaproteobacteria bacterium]
MKLSRIVLPLALATAWSLPAAAQWPFADATPKVEAAATVTPVRVFRLAGVVRERALPFDFLGDGSVVFPDLLRAIHEESERGDVKALVFKLGGVALGMTHVEELASAFADAQKKGKRVIVHLESGDLTSLGVASHADVVHLTPEGSLFVNGLQAEVAFYRDLLGTIGVEADVEAVGQYKSAMEPFTRTSLSEPARANLDALLDSIFASVLDGVGKPRKMTRGDVQQLVDKGLFTADQAKKAKLVDELSYWPEVLESTAKLGPASLAWPKPSAAPDLSSMFDLLKLLGGDEPAPTGPAKSKVAVLVAEGAIIEGRDPSDLFSEEAVIASEDFLDALHDIEADPNVKALVLRVNSPGGSALASDVMWRELVRVGKARPLVVSMGDYAASGGYYLASAGRKIFAGRTTLTGSIGVFGGKLVYKGLLDKVGVQTTIIARGKHAGLFSGLARFTDSEREVFRQSMRHTYETFVNKVARGRNMSFDAIDKLAQGRVWTGEQAVEVGLVDRIGGLTDAIAEAAKLAKLGEDYEVVTWPKERSFLDLFDKGAASKRIAAPRLDVRDALPQPLAARARALGRVVEGLLGKEQVLALMPFVLTWR